MSEIKGQASESSKLPLIIAALALLCCCLPLAAILPDGAPPDDKHLILEQPPAPKDNAFDQLVGLGAGSEWAKAVAGPLEKSIKSAREKGHVSEKLQAEVLKPAEATLMKLPELLARPVQTTIPLRFDAKLPPVKQIRAVSLALDLKAISLAEKGSFEEAMACIFLNLELGHKYLHCRHALIFSMIGVMHMRVGLERYHWLIGRMPVSEDRAKTLNTRLKGYNDKIYEGAATAFKAEYTSLKQQVEEMSTGKSLDVELPAIIALTGKPSLFFKKNKTLGILAGFYSKVLKCTEMTHVEFSALYQGP